MPATPVRVLAAGVLTATLTAGAATAYATPRPNDGYADNDTDIRRVSSPTLTVSLPPVVTPGKRYTLSGIVKRTSTKRKVVVQQRKGKKWVKVGSATTKKNGRFAIKLKAPSKPGLVKLRVTSAKTKRHVNASVTFVVPVSPTWVPSDDTEVTGAPRNPR